MATNIRPLHDRVIVRRIEEGEQVRGGIIIPDTAKEKPQEGEVVAVGEGKYKEDGTRQSLDVKQGDRVLFGKYSGSEIKIDGEELLIMREDEILGIIERAGAASRQKGRQVVKQTQPLFCSRSNSTFSRREERMAKQVIHGEESRAAILRGINQLADAVKITLGPKGPQRGNRQEIWLTHDHQRRRYRRERD